MTATAASFAYGIQADGAHVRQARSSKAIPGMRFTWQHVEGRDSEALDWMRTHCNLPSAAVVALTAVETRPRAIRVEDGLVVILRGVNHNPDADPDDLVSMRLWVTSDYVLSVCFRPLLALPGIIAAVEAGQSHDPGDFIALVAYELTARLDEVLGSFTETLDTLEEDFESQRLSDLRERLGFTRRATINLRRFIAPQRDALETVIRIGGWLLDEQDRQKILEAVDRVTRMIEELEASRERAAVLADELGDLRAESVAQRTLVLSVVSSIFLPLSFLTGLIGMNVAGIPFAEEKWAFGAIVTLTVGLAVGLFWWLRRRGWF